MSSSKIKSSKTTNEKLKNLGFSWMELIPCILLVVILHYPIFTSLNNWSNHFLSRDYFGKYKGRIAANKLKELRVSKGFYDQSRLYDQSDRQYRIFRKFFFYQLKPLTLFIIIATLIRFSLRWYYKKHLNNDKSNHQSLTSSLSKILISFYVMINLAVTYYFHGTTSTFVLLVMIINYFIAKTTFKLNHAKLICWFVNLFIIFLIIKIDRIYWSFEYLINADLKWIDESIRQRMRFTQTFRFILLRCISFNMDLIYNYNNKPIYKSKFETNMDTINDDYTLLNYIGYTLYVPLNFTGPIISFHDWISQIKSNISNTNPFKMNELKYRSIIVYAIRFIFIFFITDLMLHYIYIPLMSIHEPFPIYFDECKTDVDYAYKIFQLCAWCYVCVFFLWAKFLLIWRFQTLIALCDGIVAPENMLRCVFHHTSIIGFWKYWHASFNLWNLRYIYIPLGGSKVGNIIFKFINIILVFTFTTLWHGDFEFKLLLWGSLMSLLIIPEILIKKYYYLSNNLFIIKLRNNQRINRYIHASGAVINIFILFIANLIGFGPGYKVIFEFLNIIIFKWSCIITFIIVYFIVFCGVLIMLHADYAQNNKGYGWYTILRLKNDKKDIRQHIN